MSLPDESSREDSRGPVGSEPPLPPDRVDPHPDRLPLSTPGYETICARHRSALDAGLAMYEDPATGLWVMTAATLWARGCCHNECRHCPHQERAGEG